VKFRTNLIGIAFVLTLLFLANSVRAQIMELRQVGVPLEHIEDGDLDLFDDSFVFPASCTKASNSQVAMVNQGNQKKDDFLQRCAQTTGGSAWCSQLIRPNPDSVSVFRCTYGESQVHQLINPDESSWKHAHNAVKLIQELEQKGFRIKLIYNWWRPEPYNKNVGGAAGRHPKGTSVDVRFVTNSEADQAFLELCKYRKQGRIRAIGHYGTNALHFGMGDAMNNTWGKTCP
jgi:hypothetical protein